MRSNRAEDILPTPHERAAELTQLGGFAVWQVDPAGLLPLAQALEPEHLAARFAATRAGLATGSHLPLAEVMPRTAVSAAQVGLISRLWSVALASLALHDWVPELSLRQLLVDPSHRNPSPMAIADPAAGTSAPGVAQAVALLQEQVVLGAVAAITQAGQEHGRTSATVLVSNAASSLVAAARVVGRKVPQRAEHLDQVTRELLGLPWLAAGGAYRQLPAESDTAATGTSEFKRTGCCLYYRLPGHGLCPDCVLVRPGHPADDHH